MLSPQVIDKLILEIKEKYPEFLQLDKDYLHKYSSYSQVYMYRRENDPTPAYFLHPPVSETQVLGFEKKYCITLPLDYRRFIIEIGNGGYGPGNALYSYDLIEQQNLNPPFDYLSTPFQLIKRWNPQEADYPSDEIFDHAIKEAHSGTIPICDEGCGMYVFLVISGPERGNVWFDDVCYRRGLFPLGNQSNCSPSPNLDDRICYCEWFLYWLIEQIEFRKFSLNYQKYVPRYIHRFRLWHKFKTLFPKRCINIDEYWNGYYESVMKK